MGQQIVVIGGGPIGAAVARFTAEEGADVLLVERRCRPAEIPACTGLVSPRTLARLGVSEQSVLREVRAMTAHAPAGHDLSLRSHEIKAVVLDRVALEEELLARAAKAGVELRMDTEARVLPGGSVELITRRGTETLNAPIVIGADGPESRVAKAAGLASAVPGLFGAQATIEADVSEPDRVDVYFEDNESLFAWRVPAEQGTIRVGVLCPEGSNPALLLRDLLARHFDGARILARVGGRIPGAPLPKTVSGRFLLVGDAAGQVKPLSGGGLFTGALCARNAARIAAGALVSAEPVEHVLPDYEAAWRAELEEELAFGLTMRSLLATSSGEDLDTFLGILDDQEVRRFIADEGDIDHMRQLLGKVSRRPALWGKLAGLVSLIDPRKLDTLIAKDAVGPVSGRPL